MTPETVSRGVTESAEQTPELSQDVAFEMLSCQRRRYVLHYLKQSGGAAELRDIVERVAAWENDVSPAEVTYEQRTRVYTALRQSHLPKLDDGGVVSFDADRGTVVLTETASELEVYLDVVPHNDIPWSKYYAGLGILCTGFVAGMWIGLLPFALIPPLVGTALVTMAFTISAAVHVQYDSRMRLGRDGLPPNQTTGNGPWE
ncbi:hypothetical protein GS429_17540 [Natronorubrum sp. JWXQ-INN-674]|uniref:DUF7344 domain-containing protein n=1 Tax=Natronorubrum halalkaliphilum TaxID=2691917 RepID=A0A6B0VSS5_9EURY|nr:hypothetical protein [Natronorubrum halalkaliphilum]MXV63832.1 hypothetical protein [Natronorubrum halalkaliphilum]